MSTPDQGAEPAEHEEGEELALPRSRLPDNLRRDQPLVPVDTVAGRAPGGGDRDPHLPGRAQCRRCLDGGAGFGAMARRGRQRDDDPGQARSAPQYRGRSRPGRRTRPRGSERRRGTGDAAGRIGQAARAMARRRARSDRAAGAAPDRAAPQCQRGERPRRLQPDIAGARCRARRWTIIGSGCAGCRPWRTRSSSRGSVW